MPEFENVIRKDMYDQSIYIVRDSAQAAEILVRLEERGFKEYQISGPTIEDAFMKIADEMTDPQQPSQVINLAEHDSNDKNATLEKTSEVAVTGQEREPELRLLTGTRVSPFQQSLILFRKRAVVFRRNSLPNLAALLIVSLVLLKSLISCSRLTSA